MFTLISINSPGMDLFCATVQNQHFSTAGCCFCLLFGLQW